MSDKAEKRAQLLARRRCETRWMQAVLNEQLAVLDDKLEAQEMDAVVQWIPADDAIVLRHAGKPWNQ